MSYLYLYFFWSNFLTRGEQLEVRVRKICDGFETTVYACPAQSRDRVVTIAEVSRRLIDLEKVVLVFSIYIIIRCNIRYNIHSFSIYIIIRCNIRYNTHLFQSTILLYDAVYTSLSFYNIKI